MYEKRTLFEKAARLFELESDPENPRNREKQNEKRCLLYCSLEEKKLLVISRKKDCCHRIGYLAERLKTQCLSQKSGFVFVAQLDRALAS